MYVHSPYTAYCDENNSTRVPLVPSTLRVWGLQVKCTMWPAWLDFKSSTDLVGKWYDDETKADKSNETDFIWKLKETYIRDLLNKNDLTYRGCFQPPLFPFTHSRLIAGLLTKGTLDLHVGQDNVNALPKVLGSSDMENW